MVVFRDADAVTNTGPIAEGQSMEKNIILIQYMADSVQIIAQLIRLQHLHHYTMRSRRL